MRNMHALARRLYARDAGPETGQASRYAARALVRRISEAKSYMNKPQLCTLHGWYQNDATGHCQACEDGQRRADAEGQPYVGGQAFEDWKSEMAAIAEAERAVMIPAGPYHGQTIHPTPENLVSLNVAPGSPQHRILVSMMQAAYFKGRSSVYASQAERLADIYMGKV